jgi:hypothetical protein
MLMLVLMLVLLLLVLLRLVRPPLVVWGCLLLLLLVVVVLWRRLQTDSGDACQKLGPNSARGQRGDPSLLVRMGLLLVLVLMGVVRPLATASGVELLLVLLLLLLGKVLFAVVVARWRISRQARTFGGIEVVQRV